MRGADEAIVLLFHGSRAAEAARAESALCDGVREASRARRVVAARLGSAPSLEDALHACRSSGVRRVFVVPMLLSPGTHAREDVPRLLARARERFADLEIRATGLPGEHPKLAEMVADLVRAARGADPPGD